MMSPTLLLKKLKMNLGLKSLPSIRDDDELLDIIYTETLPTFSNFFPHIVESTIDVGHDNRVKDTKDVYYLFDESDNNYFGEDITVLGVMELVTIAGRGGATYSGLDAAYGMNTMDTIMNNIAFSGITSLLKSGSTYGLYEFIAPNKIRICRGHIDQITNRDKDNGVKCKLYCTHPKNLATIPQTKLEFFYKLAETDVKRILFEELKRYKSIDTTYGEIDLQIDNWEDSDGSRREELIDKMRNSSLLDNQPKIMAF